MIGLRRADGGNELSDTPRGHGWPFFKRRKGISMNLKKIHHVAIIVSDYEKARNFYVDILGFKIIRENYRAERGDYKLDLAMDGCELEIFSGRDNPPRASYPEACGLRHLAFQVEDMDAVIRELNSRGVDTETVRRDGFTGKRMTFFRDPDGLPLELHE